MAYSTFDNRTTTTAKRAMAFIAAVLRRNNAPKEEAEAPQELNSRYFYEREQAARLAQAARDVNRIWY